MDNEQPVASRRQCTADQRNPRKPLRRPPERDRRSASIRLANERLHPRLSNPDFLVLHGRLAIIRRFAQTLPGSKLRILDVGGRIQPYRTLFESKLENYIAIDPRLEGQTDVVARGEALPFPDGYFDVLLCSQVLSYLQRPESFIAEAHRVLKPGGAAVVSAPALFPEHVEERWRFLPDGYRTLFQGWESVDVLPECHSASGALRTINVCLNNVHSRIWRKAFRRTLIPLLNGLGALAEAHHRGGRLLCPNYTVLAFKGNGRRGSCRLRNSR